LLALIVIITVENIDNLMHIARIGLIFKLTRYFARVIIAKYWELIWNHK